MKRRLNLYIDAELAATIDRLAQRPGTSRSRIVNDAVRALVENQAMKGVDLLLRPRLDRMQRELTLVRRDLDVILESLSLYIRHQLTVTAPLPEADKAARALGRVRFEAFVTQVGRQLRANHSEVPGQEEGQAR